MGAFILRPVSVLKRALDNIRPALEVRSRRVGGTTYQVPVEVRPGRATTLALLTVLLSVVALCTLIFIWYYRRSYVEFRLHEFMRSRPHGSPQI